MRLEQLIFGPLEENTYIFQDDAGDAVVIDPGSGAPEILAALERMGARVTAVLLTHGHYDHIGAARELAGAAGAPIFAHEAEFPLLKDPYINHSYVLPKPISITPDRALRDGDILRVGGETLSVIHTPGHTAGGVCYYNAAGGVLFSGDTLFFETIGGADFETSDYRAELASVKNRLYTLPDETAVYPGHGPRTTIGHEKKHNDCVRA